MKVRVTTEFGAPSLDSMDPGFERVDPTICKTPRRAYTGRRWLLAAGLGAVVGLLSAIGGYLVWAHTPPALVHSTSNPGPDPKLGELTALLSELGRAPQLPSQWLERKADADELAKLERILTSREALLSRLSRLLREHAPFPTGKPYPSTAELDPYYQAWAWEIAQMTRAYYRKQWNSGLQRCLDQIEIGGRLARKGYWAPYKLGLDRTLIGSLPAERFIPHVSAAEARMAGLRLERILVEFPSEAEMQPVVRAGRMRDVSIWLSHEETFREWIQTWRPQVPTSLDRPVTAFVRCFYPRPQVYAQVDDRSEVRRLELQKPASMRQNPVPATDPLARGFLFGWPWAELEHLPACRTQLQLLRLELALQEHRRATGGYPKTLAELDGRLPNSLLIDPMSGKPMAYRFPRSRTSATLRFPYLLYSYGLDREDGGGRSPAGWVADPRPGRDLVAGAIVLR